jgi:hypothetical protein
LRLNARAIGLKKFGFLMEGTLGRGRVLLTTLRLMEGLRRPQFPYFWMNAAGLPEHRYFTEGLIRYALSAEFRPRWDLSPLVGRR